MSPPFGHRPLASSSAIMTRSGLRPARIHGRGDRAPPRKPPCALSPGFPRKATSPRLIPREGRALHARKRKLELDRDISPFGRGLPLTHVVEMECLGPSSALPPGRFPAHPPGGAGSARPRERLALDRSISLLGHRPFVRSSVIIPYPRLASGLATRARRPRPSEKTTLRVIPGFSPQGHLTLARPPEGRAPHARNDALGFARARPT